MSERSMSGIALQKPCGELYLRHLSILIRESSTESHPDDFHMKEDSIVNIRGDMRCITTVLLRNKARLLSQAWSRWTLRTGLHDYAEDLKVIMSRSLGVDEFRMELELEVMFKWVLQNIDKDPTSIAHLLGESIGGMRQMLVKTYMCVYFIYCYMYVRVRLYAFISTYIFMHT